MATTRREVLIGGAALGLLGRSPASAVGGSLRGQLAKLDALRARCRRLRHRNAIGESTWRRWSDATAEREALVNDIARLPAAGLEAAAVKMIAVAGELLD